MSNLYENNNSGSLLLNNWKALKNLNSRVVNALATITTIPPTFRVFKGRVVIPAIPSPSVDFIDAFTIVPIYDQNGNQIVLKSQDQIIYNNMRTYNSVDFSAVEISATGGAILRVARSDAPGQLDNQILGDQEFVISTTVTTASTGSPTVQANMGPTMQSLDVAPESVYVGLWVFEAVPYRDSDLGQDPVFVDVVIIVI